MKLYDSQCVFLLKLGEFNVDGSGDGNFAEQTFICRGQTYFMDFQHEGDGVHNSTLFFKLGSSGPGAPKCPSAGIDIVKFTNGDDANSEPGPLIAVGSTVTWTYVVTNTGDVPLDNVVVTDDHLGTVSAFTGDTNGNGRLDTGETWTYTETGTAAPDQYENLGTVTADSVFGPVADDDPSHYFGSAPAINIVKFTNGEDADTPPGPDVASGSTVTWTYVVTNTGNVPLESVAVTDDVEGTISSFTGDTNGNGELDLTETWTYTHTGTAIGAPYSNLGTVNAESPIGQPVTDSNPSHYNGISPIP
jgi:hypothetical protein